VYSSSLSLDVRQISARQYRVRPACGTAVEENESDEWTIHLIQEKPGSDPGGLTQEIPLPGIDLLEVRGGEVVCHDVRCQSAVCRPRSRVVEPSSCTLSQRMRYRPLVQSIQSNQGPVDT
jgi:hypothetical protein